MNRREVLGSGFAAVFLTAGRSGHSLDFIPLKFPVRIPLSEVVEDWAPATFKMRFAKSNGRDTVAPGIAMRIPGEPLPCVICTYCPHEFCIFALQDSRELRCPCHLSSFDPLHHGALLEGPAPRGAWQIAYRIVEDNILVEGIEADIEKRLL